MIALFVISLFACVRAQNFHMPDSKTMTAEQFRKMQSDDMEVDPEDLPFTPTTPAPKLLNQVLGSTIRTVLDSKQLLPRDRYLEENKNSKVLSLAEASKKRSHMWLDFEAIHDQMIEEQSERDATSRRPPPTTANRRNQPKTKIQKNIQDKMTEIEPSTFRIKIYNDSSKYEIVPIVWTTCKQFKRGPHFFDPNDIVDIEWIPFYTWSNTAAGNRAIMHKFHIPTKQEVHDYKRKYSKYLNSSVDWSQSKLHMDIDRGDMKALLISADGMGLYYSLMDTEVSEYVQSHKILLPLVPLRLKIVGNYLAMMYCDFNDAVIMAKESQIPKTDKDKRQASKILKFKGIGRTATRDPVFERRKMNFLENERRRKIEDDKPFNPQMEDQPLSRKRKIEKQEKIIPDRLPLGSMI